MVITLLKYITFLGLVWFDLVSLFPLNNISTFIGNLIRKPSLGKDSIGTHLNYNEEG